MSFPPLSILFLLGSGCAASVTAEPLDGPFGPGMSAILVEDELFSAVTVSNVSGLCKADTDLSAATDDLVDLATRIAAGDDVTCADLEDPYATLYGAMEKLYQKGNHFASFDVAGGFSEGDFDVPDDSVSVAVSEVSEDFDASAFDDFDPDGSLAENCGMGDDAAFETFDSDTWVVSDGTLTIGAYEHGKSVSGSADGTLADDQGDNVGQLHASFHATYCDLDPG